MRVLELEAAQIVDAVRAAGVVGAGGAAFPTYVKLQSRPHTYIANGAECEPLLHVTQELMARWPERVIKGLLICMQATGAQEGVVALKAKYEKAISELSSAIEDLGNRMGSPLPVRIFKLGDFYPAGDEHVLVYEVTGKRVPQGGIPIAVGVVVNNIETLINVAEAVEGHPVTHKWITVCGAVKRPITARFPIGTPVSKALEAAGGVTAQDYVVLDGGPMMGKLVPDLSQPITKSTGGLVVLPADNRWAQLLTAPIEVSLTRARSHCIQCMNCTEMCPRYLLGHRLRPNRLMLEASYPMVEVPHKFEMAFACSECGVCEAYACPSGLVPRRINAMLKNQLVQKGVRPGAVQMGEVDPAREYRRVPTSRLKARLGIDVYDSTPELVEKEVSVDEVYLVLKQHVGVAAKPLVGVGDRVRAGQVVADVAPEQLGVPLHAPINGIVVESGAGGIRIRRDGA